MSRISQLLVAGGLFTVSFAAAATQLYGTNFTTLNDSGVTGSAQLAYNPDANTLDVDVQASGLLANKPHAQHIHGILGGDSVTPTIANSDGANGFPKDGRIAFKEARPVYGPVLVALTSPPGQGKLSPTGFPTAPDGTIDFNQTYQLGDSNIYSADSSGDTFDKNNLFPLENREIVLHGKLVPDENGGEIYKATRPVASGEITAQGVPAPGAWGMLSFGVGLIGVFVFARKRSRYPEHVIAYPRA